ncbi:DNA helicase [Malassezia arunalokei]|uniref:Transcription initiation factor IIF subunit beta n=1 Tax=Malassezia arunalokei TaxID=1514897 RepID=A0AAJ5Z328_9BASI|nr:DNA helicase [Malassezia arunalokei]
MSHLMDNDVDTGPEPASEPSTSALRHENLNREHSPEPDLDLDLTRGMHQVWLVKVPKFLIDGWSRIQQDDVPLGHVRVYDPDENGNQPMELILPESPAWPIPIEDPLVRSQFAHMPRKYDMKLTSSTSETYAKNLYAFEEELIDEDDVASDLGVDEDVVPDSVDIKGPRGTGPARGVHKKRRKTALTGTVTNETSVQPQKLQAPVTLSTESKPLLRAGQSRSLLTPEYREILRRRRIESSTPKRSVIMMESGDTGMNNMLAAGVGKGHIKPRATNIVAGAMQSRSGDSTEKFARMPRNELLDLLFNLFDKYSHWSLKRLREETQQPYVYLREVLSTIANQHHNGPYAGSWSLKREYSEGSRESLVSSVNERAQNEISDENQDMEDVVQ